MYGQLNIICIVAVQMFQYSKCSFITTYIILLCNLAEKD